MISPQRIELVINVRVAGEMGIEVPSNVLGTATRLVK
jgi:ABC-type uncharacterized transport system substrate-binding protein